MLYSFEDKGSIDGYNIGFLTNPQSLDVAGISQ